MIPEMQTTFDPLPELSAMGLRAIEELIEHFWVILPQGSKNLVWIQHVHGLEVETQGDVFQWAHKPGRIAEFGRRQLQQQLMPNISGV